MAEREAYILLVDDDDVAIEATIRNLCSNEVRLPILTAADGRDGLAVLRGEGTDTRRQGTPIVLLDLNMPNMNGFEFLQELRRDPLLRSTVVFVLTSSDSDTDRAKAYHECIAGFMVKSAVGPQFRKLAGLLQSYHAAVRLP